jgi:hypothetical protein
MLASSRPSMYTAFKKVKAIRASRRKNTIWLRARDFTRNQVYTAPEDFIFVLGFIEEHTARKARKKQK